VKQSWPCRAESIVRPPIRPEWPTKEVDNSSVLETRPIPHVGSPGCLGGTRTSRRVLNGCSTVGKGHNPLGECGIAAKPHKSCRPRSTSRLGRAPTLQAAFLPTASELDPAGRWAAHLRSEAGRGHGRFLPVTPPRCASDQGKRFEAGSHRSPTPRGTNQGRGWGTHQGRDRGVIRDRSGGVEGTEKSLCSRQDGRSELQLGTARREDPGA
jgi:hypothetical protein